MANSVALQCYRINIIEVKHGRIEKNQKEMVVVGKWMTKKVLYNNKNDKLYKPISTRKL